MPLEAALFSITESVCVLEQNGRCPVTVLDENKEEGKMMELQEGRPENAIGRTEREKRVYDLLDSLGISYMRVDHDALPTMEACREVEKILDSFVCKNLFLCNSGKTKFYLLMMPGGKKFKTKELSAQINSPRLSFADEKYMEEFLDITPGSVSVVGLMNDTEGRVQLLVDEDVLTDGYIGCHPCINTSSLKIKASDIFDKFLKAVHHEPIFVKLKGED